MPDKTFKIIELCGVSENSYAEATKNAVAKASQTLRNLDWFEVLNQRGVIKNGEVAEVPGRAEGRLPGRIQQGSRLMPGLALRDFHGLALGDRVPDHSSLAVIG
jgi:dodecin